MTRPLESHNYLSKIKPKLETDDGQITTNQHDILKASEFFFYKNLYSNKDDPHSETDLQEYLQNTNQSKLTNNREKHNVNI